MDVRKKREANKGERGDEGISRPWPPHARNTPTGTGTGWPNRICIIICSTQIRFIRYQNFPRPCLHGLCSASPSRAVGVTAMLRKTYFIISRTCRGRPCACRRRRRLCVPSFQVLGKNKMGSSRAEEEEEDENMTKMGGNKMDRLRTSSSSSSSRAAVAAAAVAQFFSADERSWMVL